MRLQCLLRIVQDTLQPGCSLMVKPLENIVQAKIGVKQICFRAYTHRMAYHLRAQWADALVQTLVVDAVRPMNSREMRASFVG